MKLISMTDFVLEQSKLKFTNSGRWDEARWYNSLKYANFLKQPLTLGMFVSCDDGNVLEIPTKENSNNTIDHDTKLMDYNDSKSKVLFNGFYVTYSSDNKIYLENEKGQTVFFWKKNQSAKTIQDLIPYNLDLSVSF